MLRRIANVFEGLVAVAFVVTVILLFTNQPTETPPSQVAAAVDAYGLPIGTSADGAAVAAGPDGAAIFDQRCSACHGSDGGGGIGPALAVDLAGPAGVHVVKVLAPGLLLSELL